jgi:hypothetical protein
MKIFRISLLVSLLAAALGAGAQGLTREQYIEKYKKLAIEARDAYGIPASITMAQALFESDNGNSRLATLANNHFGIKCKKEWTGGTISHDDDAKGECFRKYPTIEDSYRDHSVFLQSSPRYASLFKLKVTDYQGWAYGLKAAGYATNPQYAQRLITVIEDNKLYLLDDAPTTDAMLAEEKAAANVPIQWGEWKQNAGSVDVDNYVASMRSKGGYSVYMNNGSEFVLAGAGDTFETLAGKVGASAAALRRFNDLPKTAQPAEGDMVYIKRKARRAENGKLIHVAEQGDTMHSLSQKYGIRLQSLASMNHRSASGTLVPGQQLRLM